MFSIYSSSNFKVCYVMLCYVMLCFFTTRCSLRLIVRSELDVPTFATRCLHARRNATAPSSGRRNCGR